MLKEQLLKKVRGELEDPHSKIVGRYLYCKISDKGFLIDINTIKEIIDIGEKIVPVPGAHAGVLGTLNLRGSIVPVVDIRNDFGLNSVMRTELSRYVIFEYQNELLGLLADEASEVINAVADDYVEPEERKTFFTEYLKVKGQILGILNTDKIFIDYRIR